MDIQLQRPFRYQHLIILLTLLLGTSAARSQTRELDSLALVALYDSTDISGWDTPWDLGAPMDTWNGITVTAGRVTVVSLYSNNLDGNIPSNMGNLTNLVTLEMSQNNLTGSIPASIGDLTKLVSLRLGLNSLSGSIPSTIGALTNLETLILTGNDLSGPLPATIGSLAKLKRFELVQNSISGSIPAVIGNLDSLQYLDLMSNEFAGSIPPELGDLSKLQSLNLGFNSLTDTLPPALSNLDQLYYLFLGGNQLIGSIPPEYMAMTSLTTFNINSNTLTGEIPPELAGLTGLYTLNLGFNRFTGTIPPELGTMNGLTVLNLAGNQLTGSIPVDIANLSNLYWLLLNSNQLSGDVPVELAKLPDISWLSLGNNNFTGLPDLSLDSLVSTITMSVSWNAFTFEDLEPNVSYFENIVYSPQANIGTRLDTTLLVGSDLVLSVSVGGTVNHYSWLKDNVAIANTDNDTLVLEQMDINDSGVYTVIVTNDSVPGLNIYSNPMNITVATSIANERADLSVPDHFDLRPAYPNPFNPATTIKFQLPEAGEVSLLVFDLTGREVAHLLNDRMEAGYHQVRWVARAPSGRIQPSGVYIARLLATPTAGVTPGYTSSIKLVLLK